MGGREFGPPPHVLSERGALVHRAASRATPTGHSPLQHPGLFQPGKYYSSPAPTTPHSAPIGHPQFSGRIAHSFLPMNHLSCHGKSSILYGEHRFYDTQSDPFYLRTLLPQSPLLLTNHSFPPVPPPVPGNPLGPDSQEQGSGCRAEAGGGAELHPGLKEGGAAWGQAPKENERPSSKLEAQNRVHRGDVHPMPCLQNLAPLQEDILPVHCKILSACLLIGGGAKGSLPSCGAGSGARPDRGRAMRISKSPCLENDLGGFPSLHPHPPDIYRTPPHHGPPLLPSPTFVPSVGPHRDRSSRLVNPECWGLGGGGPSAGENVKVASQRHGQKVGRIRHQPPDTPPWVSGGCQGQMEGEEGHRKVCLNSVSSTRQPDQSEWEQRMAPPPAPPTSMKSQLKYSHPQSPPLFQSSAGLGCLKSRGVVGSRTNCNQTLPTKKGSANEEERADCCGRGQKIRDGPHGEGEVRQPPVGIAVAVARQREPPCLLLDPHIQTGGAHPAMKDVCRFPLDGDADVCRFPLDGDAEIRQRVCKVLPSLGRERELLIRENKERVDYSRIHPSSSCHSDLASHLIMMGGTSLQARQLHADLTTHVHAPHHHWTPQTGSPSLWMAGHCYGISCLHQNLPPGFSVALPSALQSVLPLPRDPPAQQLLPSEPPNHPASHPSDLMELSGLWPSVFGAQTAHPSVYTHSQFLRQQALYTLQQQQRERVAQVMESQHRSQVQRKQEDPPELSRPRSPKPIEPFSFTPSPPGSCPSPLSPCCHSPSLGPRRKSTPCTAGPAPSPATAPHSPALSPAPPHPSKATESQDKRAEGQAPQDYPQSRESDLPPEYTCPAVGYRRGPSPLDLPLAEPADLEVVQVEPAPQPLPLPAFRVEPPCGGVFSPMRTVPEEVEPNTAEMTEGVEGGVATSSCTCPYLGQEGAEPDISPTANQVCPTSAVTHGDDPPIELGEEEELEEGSVEMKRRDEEDLDLCRGATPVTPSAEETRGEEPQIPPTSTSCPAPVSQTPPTVWSLELLIAAALCGVMDTPALDPAPAPLCPAHTTICPAHIPPCPAHSPPCPRFHGMELLSELADLELQHHKGFGRGHGEEELNFDLRSLATLAAARALELGAGQREGPGEGGGDAQRGAAARRTLNLRRKCTWTPRHQPVCPVKDAMETMDGQEVAIRVQLAELQRRYKEKQRELAKLQRKQEPFHSPVRRGRGRPRKRRSTPNTSPAAPAPAPRRAKSQGAGLSQLMDDLSGSGQRKEETLSNQDHSHRHKAQQLERGSGVTGGAAMVGGFHRWGQGPRSKRTSTSRGHSSTALAGGGLQEVWAGRMLMLRQSRTKGLQTGSSAGRKQEVADTSNSAGRKQEVADTSNSAGRKQEVTEGDSFQPVVKLEANKKAKKKKERQALLGSVRVSCVAEAKVRRRAPYSPNMVTTQKRILEPEEEEEEGERGKRSQGCRQLGYSGVGLQVSPATSKRLKKATPQRIVGKGRGHAVSRLLQSFAADEGFQMDEDGSFSESEEPDPPAGHLPPRKNLPVMPSCVLSKEQLVDGLKVLISKEDELLYAAYLHTLDLPGIYSVVIDGERGNRPRVYSLEQLLQEAVLDMRPQSEAELEQGTRVCAYWSERSRCLYPGYVHRAGGPGEQQKEGSVMVEFDDGDRGWISLRNIRLLPPAYQIRCAEPAPTLLMSACHRRRRSSTLETSTPNTYSDRPHSSTAKPGSVNSGRKCPPPDSRAPLLPLLSWPSVATPRRRDPHSCFPLDGAARRSFRRKGGEICPLPAPPSATPATAIFSRPFEVPSFRSIAHGCHAPRHAPRQGPGEGGPPRGQGPCGGGGEGPVKLDREGVTAPKTKNSKARMQQAGAETDRAGPGWKGGVSEVPLAKDSKKGGAGGKVQAEGFLRGGSRLHKPPYTQPMGTVAECNSDCHGDCHASCSDFEEEEERRTAAMAGSFLCRLPVSSCSSGFSSSSSSSLCSSSLCSSENDSSCSSEDEEGAPPPLLLQGCLSSHHALLQVRDRTPHPPPTVPCSFMAKVTGTNKPIRRKEGPDSAPSAKRQRASLVDTPLKESPLQPPRQLWKWSGNPTQRRGMKGRARRLFHRAVVRGSDSVRVGDCAVFLSHGRPRLPYVGRVLSLWESWSRRMVVKVQWFYHPEETRMGKRHRDGKHALYQSGHEDENDVQTISHRCQVVSRAEYERLSRGRKRPATAQDLYYLAGTYDPASGQLLTAEGEAITC